MSKQRPLLSICMIFRDDIRSIECCLKALEPLRKAIPCELVMADTGSEDGSRQVAEQYADVLFDFEWINDFSAARNAVLDRSTGKWQFILDTDEYIDENVNELKYFLTHAEKSENAAMVVIRNYDDYDLSGNYTDFMGLRLLRASEKIRYHGRIHESFSRYDSMLRGPSLPHVILHHDGYVGLYDERGAKKRERNLTMIREKMREDPNNILVLLQYIESGSDQSDVWDVFQRALDLMEEKVPYWDRYGPAILRLAVTVANEQKRADTDKWIERAQTMFPDSYFTRLDVQYLVFARCRNANDYSGCIKPGETYLDALKEYKDGKAKSELATSTFRFATKSAEQGARTALADAYRREGLYERAVEMLAGLDYETFDVIQTTQAVMSLMDIQFKSALDVEPVLLALWDGITMPTPSQEVADGRRKIFCDTVSASFTYQNRRAEAAHEEFCRNAYTLVLPLAGKCELGRAAAMLQMNDPDEMETKLSEVEDWNEFPASALAYALEYGVKYPLTCKPLNLEEMDTFATRIAQDQEGLYAVIAQVAGRDLPEDSLKLTWLRGLLLAAVQTFNWKAENVSLERGLTLAREFARTEEAFLPRYYAQEVLQESRIAVLPPLHRFGFYCARAFTALDAGDRIGFVRLLRKGLEISKDMKPMVEFLLSWVEREEKATQIATAPPELMALAEQVKLILTRFEPDDPAVAELKKSPAYQQVAWLIEEPARPAFTEIAQ